MTQLLISFLSHIRRSVIYWTSACLDHGKDRTLPPRVLSLERDVHSFVISLRRSRKTCLNQNQSLLLDTLLEIDPLQKHGCRKGICRQCTCLKISGSVRVVKTGEVFAGNNEFIQLCLTQPLTDLVLDL